MARLEVKREKRKATSERLVKATAPVEGIALAYDYSQIEDAAVRAEVQEAARTIKLAGQRIQSDLLLVAKTLLRVKENKLFPTAQFADWTQVEFNLDPRRAQYWMHVARVYGTRPDGATLVGLMGDYVARIVAAPSTPPEAREAIEQRVQAGEKLSTRQVQRLIAQVKDKPLDLDATVEYMRRHLDELPEDEVLEVLETGDLVYFEEQFPVGARLSMETLATAVTVLRTQQVEAHPASHAELVDAVATYLYYECGDNYPRQLKVLRSLQPDALWDMLRVRRLTANEEDLLAAIAAVRQKLEDDRTPARSYVTVSLEAPRTLALALLQALNQRTLDPLSFEQIDMLKGLLLAALNRPSPEEEEED
jgi:hypothetical protein